MARGGPRAGFARPASPRMDMPSLSRRACPFFVATGGHMGIMSRLCASRGTCPVVRGRAMAARGVLGRGTCSFLEPQDWAYGDYVQCEVREAGMSRGCGGTCPVVPVRAVPCAGPGQPGHTATRGHLGPSPLLEMGLGWPRAGVCCWCGGLGSGRGAVGLLDDGAPVRAVHRGGLAAVAVAVDRVLVAGGAGADEPRAARGSAGHVAGDALGVELRVVGIVGGGAAAALQGLTVEGPGRGVAERLVGEAAGGVELHARGRPQRPRGSGR